MKIFEKYFIKDISNIVNEYFYNFEKENVITDLKLIFKFFGENNIGSPRKGETDIYEDIREYVGADIIFKRVPMVFQYISPMTRCFLYTPCKSGKTTGFLKFINNKHFDNKIPPWGRLTINTE